MATTEEALAACRERCRSLIEAVREERRRAEMWRRRCEVLGGDLRNYEVRDLSDALTAELVKLREKAEVIERDRV